MQSPAWSEVTAIFGGRMDPPHLGHREAVAGILRNPGVRNVLIIPSASPPHKPAQASAQQRTQMARLAFGPSLQHRIPEASQKLIQVNEIELKRSQKDPDRASYSFDTLQELRSQYPRLAFVLGADQFQDLPAWHRFPEILSLCHWIVLQRKPNGSDLAQKTLQLLSASGLIEPVRTDLWKVRNSTAVIHSVATDAPDLSSTQIRREIMIHGAPPPSSLLPEVEAYLKIQQLYGIGTPHDSRTNRE